MGGPCYRDAPDTDFAGYPAIPKAGYPVWPDTGYPVIFLT